MASASGRIHQQIQNSFPPTPPGSLKLSSLEVNNLRVNTELEDSLTQNHFFVGNASNIAADAGTNIQWDGTSLKLTDSRDFTVGTGDDLVITHNGTNSSITNTTGNMTLTNSGTGSMNITNTVGQNFNLATTTTTGNINIGTALTAGTFTLGTSSTSSAFLYPRTDFTAAGSTNLINKGYADSNALSVPNTTADVLYNDSGALAVDTGVFTYTTGSKTLSILADGSFVLGTGSDLTIDHDGVNTSFTNTTGNLTFTNTGTGNINLLTASGNATGAEIDLTAGNGTTTGGAIDINAGTGTTTGTGGAININAGDGGSTSGNGGNITLTPGTATGASDSNGQVTIQSKIEQKLVSDIKQVGSITDATNLSNPRPIKVIGDYAYVGSAANDTFAIYDVSDKTSPTFVGKVTDATNLNEPLFFDVSGCYAYVSCKVLDGFSIIDISDPTTPTIVSTISNATVMNEAQGICIAGIYVYVVSRFGKRITIYNVGNPSAPILVGSLLDAVNLDTCFDVKVKGKYAYVTCEGSKRFTIVDVSDPTSPTTVGSINDNTNLNSPQLFDIRGNYAYVTCNIGDSLTIIDISDPTSPSVAGVLIDNTNLNGAAAIALSGNYAFVGCVLTNVAIVDISDPTNPTYVSSCDTSTGSCRGLTTQGEYVYAMRVTTTIAILKIEGTALNSCEIGNTKTSHLEVSGPSTLNGNVVMNSGAQVFNSAMINGSTSATGPVAPISSTVVGVPDATKYEGGVIFVSNESGGAVMAFSDGTNWRRVQDRAIVT